MAGSHTGPTQLRLLEHEMQPTGVPLDAGCQVSAHCLSATFSARSIAISVVLLSRLPGVC